MLIDGDYGPDSHTDNLLYNVDNPLIQNISSYLDAVNKSKRDNGEGLIGYSITVDEDSFKNWIEQNQVRLSDKGYFI